jgi:hypothetical protein
MRFSKQLLQRFYLVVVGLAVIGFEVIVWALARRGMVRFEPKIDIAGLTAIPLFLIGIFELYRQTSVRRANFVTDYISKFYTEEGLHTAFSDLVVGYTDDKFKAVDESLKKAITNPGLKGMQEGMVAAFAATETLQNGRRPGARFYHPDYFQGSPEEQRLDVFLGYLDVIGYQYAHGLVEMADVVGMLGYQLSMVMSRAVIENYLSGTNSGWWKSKPQSQEGAMVPYVYLRILLAGFKDFNLKYQAELQRESVRAMGAYERLRQKRLT